MMTSEGDDEPAATPAGGDAGAGRRPRVVQTDHPWPDCDIERDVIEGAGYELVIGPGPAGTPEEIEALVAGADPVAIMTCWAPVSAKAIRSPADIRIVARMGVGLDNIDVAAATARGAWVTNVPDYCVEEVSDHAIALALSWLRGVTALDREAKQGRWQPGGAKVVRVNTLTFGLIGLGHIGKVTARKLAGLGVRVIATYRSDTEPPAGVEKVSLAELQAEADVIVLHLPLNETTHRMVDDGFIAACRKTPLLVNVSRGGIVDNDALARGLDSGALGGAALDVVEGEPSPPAELIARKDILVTPHVAFLSPTSLAELRRRAAEEVVRVLRGGPPHHPCNAPETGDEPLGGGVASDISIVDTPTGRIVVKQALAKLKVAADWFSDPARSLVEADALATIARLLGPGTVPRVLWIDEASHCFGMELVDPHLRNWKADLMAGKVDLATATRAGEMLGQLHTRSASDADIAKRFADRRYFEELRIRPYFDRIAERNPDLAEAVAAAVAGMADSPEKALVHGDFSPKNILADGGEAVLLDCEVAHWGDPRFDIGFCLSHLLLKAMRSEADTALHAAAATAFLAAYRDAGLAVLDARLSRITGCLILARLEGDSPVDYREQLKPGVAKRVAADLIANPPDAPDRAVTLTQEAMS